MDLENLSAEELERMLDVRRVRFVRELMIDGNQTAAAERAGYSRKAAASQGSRLMKDAKVLAYKRALARDMFERMGYDKPQLVLKLCEILDRCMEAKPHLSWDSEKRAWVPDGTWVFDARGAVKAVEAMAKLQGFNEKTTVSIENGSVEEFLKKLGEGREF